MLYLKNINRHELARVTGMTQPGITRILSGQVEATATVVYLMAKALGVRSDYLLEAFVLERRAFEQRKTAHKPPCSSQDQAPRK